jgi:tetratricopeptide (TPR) repeat protein
MRLLDAGAALFKAGRFHDALQAYERAYSLNPLGLFRFNQAACLDKLGKRELAAQRYAAYLEETPNASDADKVKARITKLHADAQAVAQAAFDRAQADFSAGRFKQAAAGFAEAYEQKPFPQFLFNIAASYDKAGDRQRAVQNYQLYLSMAPDAADADKVRNRIHRLLEMDGNALMKP